MKNVLASVIIVVLIVLCSCKKENTEYSHIRGKWVETSYNSDTIIFKRNEPDGMLELNRGKEIRNGYLLPLFGSGLYDYTITRDSISLYWGLSSCSYSPNFYFNLDLQKEQISIGNFFGDSLDYNEILIFEKI